jgi:hypothetical protein
LVAAATFRAFIQKTFEKAKKTAYDAHRELCATEKTFLDLVTDAEKNARVSVSRYESEQERIRQRKIREAEEATRLENLRLQKIADEENARLRAEAQQRADDERLALAAQIQDQGATEAEIEEVLTAPVHVPEPVYVAPMVPIAPAVPQFQRAAGLTAARKNWKAQVTNILELATYVVANPQFANLIQGNEQALNAMAKANEANLAIPGVRAFNDQTSVGVRR